MSTRLMAISWRRMVPPFVFTVWAGGASAILASFMVAHAAPLPEGVAVVAVESISDRPTWRILHTIAADCPCSRVVAEELLRRGPSLDLHETIVIAGDDDEGLSSRLTAAGFSASTVSAEELMPKFGIRGGPWLVVIDPAGEVVYSGGYAAQRPRPGVALEDAAIVSKLRHGEHVSPLPAFGCAVDPELESAIDPFRSKSR